MLNSLCKPATLAPCRRGQPQQSGDSHVIARARNRHNQPGASASRKANAMKFKEHITPTCQIPRTHSAQDGSARIGGCNPYAHQLDLNHPALGEALLDHIGQSICLHRHPARRDQTNGLQQVAQPRAPERPGQCEESHQRGLTRIVCVSSRNRWLLHGTRWMLRTERPEGWRLIETSSGSRHKGNDRARPRRYARGQRIFMGRNLWFR